MRFWTIYDRVEWVIGLTMMAATVGTVFVAAVGRTMGVPLTSAPQFAQLFLLWTCMFGADLAMKQGGHIRVSALPDLASPRVQTALAWMHAVLMLAFLAFVAVLGWTLSMGNWQRELGASGLSYGIVTLAVSVGAGLLAISVVRRLVTRGAARAFVADPDVPGEVL